MEKLAGIWIRQIIAVNIQDKARIRVSTVLNQVCNHSDQQLVYREWLSVIPLEKCAENYLHQVITAQKNKCYFLWLSKKIEHFYFSADFLSHVYAAANSTIGYGLKL